jgi:hypothetical protein
LAVAWFTIRIGNVDPDLGARKLPKLTNKPDFLPFKKVLYLRRCIFNVKIQDFVTLKSDQDPDPHLFGSLDPDPHCDKKLDPDPQ